MGSPDHEEHITTDAQLREALGSRPDPRPPTPLDGSVAQMLDNDADAVQDDVARLSRRIESLEREIVEARSTREEQARRMVEMRAAANILREVGLRSSLVKGVPMVEVDYQPKRPEVLRMTESRPDPRVALLADVLHKAMPGDYTECYHGLTVSDCAIDAELIVEAIDASPDIDLALLVSDWTVAEEARSSHSDVSALTAIIREIAALPVMESVGDDGVELISRDAVLEELNIARESSHSDVSADPDVEIDDAANGFYVSTPDVSADLAAALEAWVEKQKQTPWSEGSFASRMTGEEGYDAAVEEVAGMLEYHRAKR